MKLRQAVSTPQTKRTYTRHVFAKIADRYDLVNVLLSFNRDQAWKRRMVRRAEVRPGERALDLACGTGDIAFRVAAAGARVVGLDVVPRMVELACVRRAGPPSARTPSAAIPARFLVGDMMALPFPDASFSLVTTGYGLRNVPDIDGALAEIHRVLEPGGRFFSLDFNRPENGFVRATYLAYLAAVGSAFGWALHRDPDTYRYIPETIRTYPGARGIVDKMRRAGFEPSYRPVFGPFMALHEGRKGDAGAEAPAHSGVRPRPTAE